MIEGFSLPGCNLEACRGGGSRVSVGGGLTAVLRGRTALRPPAAPSEHPPGWTVAVPERAAASPSAKTAIGRQERTAGRGANRSPPTSSLDDTPGTVSSSRNVTRACTKEVAPDISHAVSRRLRGPQQGVRCRVGLRRGSPAERSCGGEPGRTDRARGAGTAARGAPRAPLWARSSPPSGGCPR